MPGGTEAREGTGITHGEPNDTGEEAGEQASKPGLWVWAERWGPREGVPSGALRGPGGSRRAAGRGPLGGCPAKRSEGLRLGPPARAAGSRGQGSMTPARGSEGRGVLGPASGRVASGGCQRAAQRAWARPGGPGAWGDASERSEGWASARQGRVPGGCRGALNRLGLRSAGRMTGGGQRALRGPTHPGWLSARGGPASADRPDSRSALGTGEADCRERQPRGPGIGALLLSSSPDGDASDVSDATPQNFR